jgi:cohesin loading factor subunit SCC2
MSSSSSSLALALGDPQKPSTSSVVTPSQPQYQPQESAQFFDTFIAETSNEIVAPQSAPSPPPSMSHSHQFVSDIRTPVRNIPSVPEPPVSSPDPLMASVEGFTTPRKRKPDELTSPTLKRTHPSEKSGVLRQRSGSSHTSSFSRTTSSGSQPNKRLSVFVELPHPPKGWSTPSTAGRSTKFQSLPSTRTEDDLGGFSPPPESEWEDDHKGLKSGSKSTGKRTGDRDERGMVHSPLSSFFLRSAHM